MDDKNNKLHTSKTGKAAKKKGEDEQTLWEIATKDVTPLNPEKSQTTPAKAPLEKQTIPKPKRQRKKAEPQPTKREENHEKSNETDRRTTQRLKRGQLPIEGRLDLHGMTQHQAYEALCRYIPAAYGQGKRCILVITGKGLSRSGNTHILDQKPGVLRQKTPQWLSEAPLKQFILKTEPAKQNDGGHGALYVLLRRNKSL